MTTKPTHTPGPKSYGIAVRYEDDDCYIALYTTDKSEPLAVIPVAVALAAPDYDRIAKDIAAEIDIALAPGSRDTFMTLVNRLNRWRGALRSTIAKADGK